MRFVLRIAAVLSLVVFLGAGSAVAQFEEGKKFIGPRIGLSGVGSSASIGAAFEFAKTDRIGIGAFGDYWSYGFLGESVSYTALGALGSYHFEVSDSKWDPFVGLALGYYVVSYSNILGQNAPLGSRIFLGGQGGVRYFFKESTAFVARAGFGASYLSVGLDFAF